LIQPGGVLVFSIMCTGCVNINLDVVGNMANAVRIVATTLGAFSGVMNSSQPSTLRFIMGESISLL